MPLVGLREAIAQHVRDGQTLALEGFTHLIPFAAGHEIIRQGRRDLHLVRMTPDLVYDQMIGAGCARALTFSWGGNPGVGSLHRLRDAVEHGWPRPLALTEHSHAGMAAAYTAGASRLPFACPARLRRHRPAASERSDPQRHLPLHRRNPRHRPRPPAGRDHPPRAEGRRKGQRAAARHRGRAEGSRARRRGLLVTVEEIVDDLEAPMNAIVLPHWVVTAVACVRGGAWPSYAQGYYARDNAFYQAWDDVARDRDSFARWIDRHVTGTADHAAFLRSLEAQRGAAGGEGTR